MYPPLPIAATAAGRTARGGEAEGIAIAIVTPKESARYAALLRAMGRGDPPEFPLVRGLGGGSRVWVWEQQGEGVV